MKIKYASTSKLPQDNSGQNHEDQGNTTSTLKYLMYFALLVFLAIVFAITIRIIVLMRQSTYTGDAYAIFVNSKSPFIVSLDTSQGTLYFLDLKKTQVKNRISLSLLSGVPIDGEAKTTEGVFSQGFLSQATIFDTVLNPLFFSFKNMTVIDLVRFIMDAQHISSKNTKTYSVIFSEKTSSGISDSDTYTAFKDPDVINDGLSVEVVNATDLSGLAGKVGQVLKNMGANVISVTSRPSQDTSQINSSGDSKTIDRVALLFHIKKVISSGRYSTADIQIVLGKDFLKQLN